MGERFAQLDIDYLGALPEIINRLCDPAEKVYQTSAKRNWGSSITIDDPEGPYFLF